MILSVKIKNSVTGLLEDHDIDLSEKAIAMLAAHNITDWRLQHNIKAGWENPKDPRGLIKNLDGPAPLKPRFLDDDLDPRPGDQAA